MDDIDRDILILLLKQGSISKSELSKITGSSPQKINYRMKKLYDDGIIKNFRVHINPYFLSGVNLFLAYEGTTDIELKGIGSVFRCLERTDFYEVQAKNERELLDIADFMNNKFGHRIMQYRPRIPEIRTKVNYYDLLILRELIKDPTLDSLKLSRTLGLKTSLVRKRMNSMNSVRAYSIVPIVDLTRADIYLYTIISSTRVDDKVNINNAILKIIENETSIYVGIERSMSGIKNNVARIRKFDSKAEVMIVYDYDFRSDFAEKAINDLMMIEEMNLKDAGLSISL